MKLSFICIAFSIPFLLGTSCKEVKGVIISETNFPICREGKSSIPEIIETENHLIVKRKAPQPSCEGFLPYSLNGKNSGVSPTGVRFFLKYENSGAGCKLTIAKPTTCLPENSANCEDLGNEYNRTADEIIKNAFSGKNAESNPSTQRIVEREKFPKDCKF